VATEIALALMLLVGAGLLMRSFASLVRWEPGFERSNLLTFSAFASTERYPDGASVAALWRRLEEEIGAVPGVASVSTVSAGPLFGGVEPGRFEIVGRPSLRDSPVVRWYDAGPAYFRTLGVLVVRGRELTESDVAGAPSVALINETFTSRWFPGVDPIGQRVRMIDHGTELEIVGVVKDVAPFFAGRPVEPEIWWSNRQQARWGTFFVVRGATDPVMLAPSIRQRVDAVDAELQTGTPATIDQIVGRQLVGPRFNLVLVGVLAVVALVLATAGVYGVLAYAVETRRREIGIRIALGASRAAVVRRIVADAAAVSLVGLAAGTTGALLLSHFLRSMLYGVAPNDPTTLAATSALLALVALAACAIPALRASRVDPARALREE
jgi:predicted permease